MDNSNENEDSVVNIDDIINEDNVLVYEYFKNLFEDEIKLNETYDITVPAEIPKIETCKKRKSDFITEPDTIQQIILPNIQSNLYEVNYQNMLYDTDIYLEISRSDITKLLETMQHEKMFIPLKIAKINNSNFNMNIVKNKQ